MAMRNVIGLSADSAAPRGVTELPSDFQPAAGAASFGLRYCLGSICSYGFVCSRQLFPAKKKAPNI